MMMKQFKKKKIELKQYVKLLYEKDDTIEKLEDLLKKREKLISPEDEEMDATSNKEEEVDSYPDCETIRNTISADVNNSFDIIDLPIENQVMLLQPAESFEKLVAKVDNLISKAKKNNQRLHPICPQNVFDTNDVSFYERKAGEEHIMDLQPTDTFQHLIADVEHLISTTKKSEERSAANCLPSHTSSKGMKRKNDWQHTMK